MRWTRVWAVVSVCGGGRLDELDQHAAGVLGVDEVDPAVGRAALRGVVQQPEAALAQDRADLVDVGDAVGELLEPRAERSRNLAIVELSSSGASSWMQEPESPTATIASRTPCSSLVSWCGTSIPKVSR